MTTASATITPAKTRRVTHPLGGNLFCSAIALAPECYQSRVGHLRGARRQRSILDFLLDIVGGARQVLAAFFNVLTETFDGIAGTEAKDGEGEGKTGDSQMSHRWSPFDDVARSTPVTEDRCTEAADGAVPGTHHSPPRCVRSSEREIAVTESSANEQPRDTRIPGESDRQLERINDATALNGGSAWHWYAPGRPEQTPTPRQRIKLGVSIILWGTVAAGAVMLAASI
jgi:hypothetical protein